MSIQTLLQNSWMLLYQTSSGYSQRLYNMQYTKKYPFYTKWSAETAGSETYPSVVVSVLLVSQITSLGDADCSV